MSSLQLKDSPTLPDLQDYVRQMMAERGFADNITQRFMMLVEEVGEFAKASRKHAGLRLADGNQGGNPAHEAADVLIILLGLCNHLGIDLEQAMREKEELNKQRIWK
jgi:NTP pyrophosphatase (non-canonical NTP hydrolase)